MTLGVNLVNAMDLNTLQYRLWAEMIVGGSHESLSEAPSVPMFGAKRPRGQGG